MWWHLVLVVEKLDDTAGVGGEVLDGDHPHDVGSILLISRGELVTDDDTGSSLVPGKHPVY